MWGKDCIWLAIAICGIRRTRVWVLILSKPFQLPVLEWVIHPFICFWSRDNSMKIFNCVGVGTTTSTLFKDQLYLQNWLWEKEKTYPENQRRQWQPTPVAWWAAVHGVATSRTRLSDFTLIFHFHALEKEMATHFSILTWRIPGMEEPGGLWSMGSHRVGHDWSSSSSRFIIAFLPRSNRLLISWLRMFNEVKWSEIAQLCPTLCDPMDCSLPGSSVHGIF